MKSSQTQRLGMIAASGANLTLFSNNAGADRPLQRRLMWQYHPSLLLLASDELEGSHHSFKDVVGLGTQTE